MMNDPSDSRSWRGAAPAPLRCRVPLDHYPTLNLSYPNPKTLSLT